ncbi:MAG: sugar phosphate isomerase/epimerase [Ignavibacteriales bacterium]|nr:sugar phosphate isomerase/epimerase [Ignavibacteriales bacterium]
MTPLDLGILSDELSPDFREAVQIGLEWGLRIFEVRELKTGRIPDVDGAEFDELMSLVREHGVRIAALSPGIFKHSLSKQKELSIELSDKLPRTIEMAKRLGTPLIIVFGFQRGTDDTQGHYQDAVKLMREAAVMAERESLKLAIENEPGFWCDSGMNTAKFIEDVGSQVVGANWDPCNGYGTDERPFPAGYNAVKDFIFNVHVKDTREGSLIKCVPVGEGVIDWKGQLRALVKDQPVGHVTIETHCLPLVEKSRQNVDTLRRYLAEIDGTKESIS